MVIVIEEVQGFARSRPDELTPHGLQLGGGGLQNFRCGVKRNMIAGPGTFNRCTDQHDPYSRKPDECLEVPVFIFTPERVGAEEIMEQRSRPGRVSYNDAMWLIASSMRHLGGHAAL